jgi:cell division septal protein FtsQ
VLNVFQISPRNRRRGGGFRLSAETGASAATRRRYPWWFRPLFTIALLAGLWFGGVAAVRLAREHWLYHIEALALRQVIVTRDGVLTEDEIRRLAGAQPRRNVLTIDLHELRQRLLRHPRIESATVRLEFPDTLQLAVRERVPVARVLLPAVGDVQGFYLLDETAHVLLPFEAGLAPKEVVADEAALPLVIGMPAAGPAAKNPQLLAALHLLAGFDSSAMAGITAPVSVDISAPGVLTVLSAQGARVTLARDDLEHQLREWRAVHERVLTLGRAIGTLDLSVRGNSPLKLLEAGAAPAPVFSPQPVRPLRRSNRHV